MAAKRQRILNVVSHARTSIRTLDRIFADLRENPSVIYEANRKTMSDAQKAECKHLMEELTVPVPRAASFRWPVVSLPQVLVWLTSTCIAFRRLLIQLYEKHRPTPAKPWSLLVYGDEATPGAVLRQDNRRKTMAIHATILQFGPDIYKHDAAWLPLAFLRSVVYRTVEGRWARCFDLLMRHIFLHLRLDTVGVCLPGIDAGRPAMAFFNFGGFLADLDTHRSTWSIKGYQGNVPCWYCSNVCGLGPLSLVPHDSRGVIVDIACADPTKFKKQSSAELFAKCDALTALKPRLGITDFESQETAFGINFNPYCICWDRDIREMINPVDGARIDPMHTFYNDGLCNTEIELILPRLKSRGIHWETIGDYMQGNWRSPAAFGRHRWKDIFSEKRGRHFEKTGNLGASASETLMLMPIMAFMLAQTPWLRPALSAEIESFSALARVVRLLQRAKMRSTTSRRLFAAIKVHAQKKRLAYAVDGDESAYKFKGHTAFHLLEGLAEVQDEGLGDCFVCERLHVLTKALTGNVDYTSVFEQSSLELVLLATRDRMMHTNWDDDLIHPKMFDGQAIALQTRFHGTLISSEDVVFVNEKLVQVKGFLRRAEGLLVEVAIDAYKFVEQLSEGACKWKFETSGFIQLDSEVDIRLPQVCTFCDANCIVAIS